ncbi:UDP-glycosyltransferase 86A2-like [Mangifera indica]|uniref:UDP-glycosyltransferase 86A2-like n=1 Tax=Mangifera indica TaxID=29780 RepID=UPI001CFC0605|nr:UDP-glycosyltransferase 86A2-like [Mangifera indica]
MADKSQKLHAIFIPYPLQGHVNPSVQLALKLASQGFTITFINTESVHNQASKAHSKNGTDIFAKVRDSGLDIRYMTVSDGLPVGFDRSLNHDQFMAALLHVFSAHAEDVVNQIIQSGQKVHCLIADTYFVWPSKVAKKFGMLYISFWTETALVFTLYYHLDLLKRNGHFACTDCREDAITYIPGVKSIELKDTTSYLQETCSTTVCHQIISNAFEDTKNADFVLCNTAQELETETISALRKKMSWFAVGPIFSSGFTDRIVSTSMWSESDCSPWLGKKRNDSVLYVSFGSYAHLTKKELEEIAQGLSLSKVSFIWVLRPDIVSTEVPNPLPDGFREEVAGQGMIVPWCCQKEVLAHPAIGGFLTHCGWNSVLESMWCEVPMLCYPLYTDQFTNRKLVVDDWKIGINLSNQKIVTKEEVSKNVNHLMGEKSGEAYRNSVKEVKRTMENGLKPGGSSANNMDQFIKDLKAKIQNIK